MLSSIDVSIETAVEDWFGASSERGGQICTAPPGWNPGVTQAHFGYGFANGRIFPSFRDRGASDTYASVSSRRHRRSGQRGFAASQSATFRTGS